MRNEDAFDAPLGGKLLTPEEDIAQHEAKIDGWRFRNGHQPKHTPDPFEIDISAGAVNGGPHSTVGNRTFATGANRNPDVGKLDYEGFLSPRVLKRFAQYMDKHRHLADGTLRDSDNWQKGIPIEVYAKSKQRHDFDIWCWRRGVAIDEPIEDALCASLFNTMGLLLEVMKAKDEGPRHPNIGMNPALGAPFKGNVDTPLTPTAPTLHQRSQGTWVRMGFADPLGR